MSTELLTAGWGVERGLVLTLLSGAMEWDAYCTHLLARAVERVHADAGELFLRDLHESKLVLEAVYKLNPARVGILRLSPGEGIIGTALSNEAGLIVDDRHANPASLHPADFSTTPLPSMMVAWLGEKQGSTGMFVLYREGVGSFTAEDLRQANLVAKQLEVMLDFGSVVVSFVKPQMVRHNENTKNRGHVRHFLGKMLAPGRRMGLVTVHRHESAADLLEHERLCRDDDTADLDRFEKALQRTHAELKLDREELARRIPEAAIMLFDAHEMMLQDDQFCDKIRLAVKNGMGVAHAISEAAAEFIRIFESSQHEYIREKARDVEDLAMRLLDNLVERNQTSFGRGRIIVTRELRPSEIVQIARADVSGVVLCSGGATAHIAMLMKSLGIPAMIARSPDVLQLVEGQPALLDADGGLLVVNPPEDVRNAFLKRAAMAEAQHRLDEPIHEGGALTKDGTRIQMLTNVNLLSEIEGVKRFRADGIGLYRTEIAYLVRDGFPCEEDLAKIYGRFFNAAGKLPVTVRTLDAGSDKFLEYFPIQKENNPALGLRSIRLTLRNPELFKQQLRAILRAASLHGDVKIMFPMVSSLDEFRAAKAHYHTCCAEVAKETGRECCNFKIGMMVELPAASELADAFAREADFFSIGTNDFIQYMLAADRSNAEMMEYFTPHAPAVLRALNRIAEAAQNAGIDCSVCGEMGHDPQFIPFFLGIGIRSLSVEVSSLPLAQRAVSSVTLAEAEAYAHALLAADTIAEAQTLLRDFSIDRGHLAVETP